MQNTDTQGLQSKAEARLASLKEEKLVTRIAVLSTSLGQACLYIGSVRLADSNGFLPSARRARRRSGSGEVGIGAA